MTSNHRMITLAREASGLTQIALAQAVGISQASLSKIEHGLDDPPPELLGALAKECDVPPEFFEQTEPLVGEGILDLFHRKRATLPAKPLRKAQALANITRLEVLGLLRSLEFTDIEPFPIFPSEEYDSPEEVADRVRRWWRIPPGPMPSLVAQIEAAGIPIVATSLGHEKLSAMSMPGPMARHLIVINSDLPASQQRFTLAHELGHLVMHTAVTTDHPEIQADVFASALLMPADDVRPALRGVRFRDLGRLKPAWRVSLAALTRRAHDLGEISDRQYRTFNMQLNQLPGGRKREPGEFPPEQPELIRRVIDHYVNVVGYTPEEVAHLAVTYEPKLRQRYFGDVQRHLRSVGRVRAEIQ